MEGRPSQSEDRPSPIESLFLSHLPLVDEVIRFVARRHHLGAADVEELGSFARLKLIEDDYAVLRRFQGRCSLRTYLVTVVHRLFLDYRASQWGKWRPSATAKRLGAVAVQLERLLTRDRQPLEVAVATLRSNHRVSASVEELRDLADRLPARLPRLRVGEDAAADLADPAPGPDSQVLSEERRRAADRVGVALDRALVGLSARDRLLLRLRFQESLPVTTIAGMIGDDAKRLYRSLDVLMRRLRDAMAAAGVTEREVSEMLEGEGLRGTGPESGNPGGASV